VSAGEYRKVLGATIPPAAPPSMPPIGSVVVSGPGWKFTAPMLLLTTLIGAFTAKMVPTPSQDSNALAEVRAAVQLEAMQNERFRAEVRGELEAQRRARDLESTEVRNRLTALEASIAYWRKYGPAPAPPDAR
jgi:hypothetical protein